MSASASRKNPVRFHVLLSLGMGVAGTLVMWWSLSQRWGWLPWLGCWLVVINGITFGYYGYDKGRAGTGQSRVPEVVLHALAGLGGSLGAFAGMTFFRHKTMKGQFRILFWCIVVVQTALVAWIIKTMWWA